MEGERGKEEREDQGRDAVQEQRGIKAEGKRGKKGRQKGRINERGEGEREERRLKESWKRVQ